MAEKDGLTVTVETVKGLHQIEETVVKFSGTDKTFPVTAWAEDIEDNAEIFSWSPAQKLLIARRSLVGAAALWLKSEKAFKTYDDLKKALAKEFPDNFNVKEIHELMASRKKKKDETCYEYMLVMKEHGKRGGFADYVAIQYIVDGIDDTPSNKIMLYGVTTYSKLKEVLAIYEKMNTNMARRGGERDGTWNGNGRGTGESSGARTSSWQQQSRAMYVNTEQNAEQDGDARAEAAAEEQNGERSGCHQCCCQRRQSRNNRQ